MRPSVILAAAVLAAAGPFVTGTARAASFDCTRARAADERAICADRTLNDQDVRMAVWLDVYRQVQLMGGNGAMRDAQRAWLAQRRTCGADRVCLAHAYDRRVHQLSDGYEEWARRFR